MMTATYDCQFPLCCSLCHCHLFSLLALEQLSELLFTFFFPLTVKSFTMTTFVLQGREAKGSVMNNPLIATLFVFKSSPLKLLVRLCFLLMLMDLLIRFSIADLCTHFVSTKKIFWLMNVAGWRNYVINLCCWVG